ncbi:hypothetical protein [Ramlibacter sp. AN1133]|uniref:hypothetical protein n=1 Tax=Ramlibacter sp. AN1133 TaxID=3133429 RepID=UPI0030C41514
MKTILIKDRFSDAPVLREMLSATAGLEVTATLAGADLAITWLATHHDGWDLAVVVVEQDVAQMDVIAFARAARPAAKIVATGSIVCGAVRSECLRCGADVAFDSRRIGDLADWLDRLSAGPS